MVYATDCRHFLGHRPCSKSKVCEKTCSFYEPTEGIVLLVQLGALGTVLRTTSLLPAIKRKYKNCKIHWLTDSPGQILLENNEYIDKVFTTDQAESLKGIKFKSILAIDKDPRALSIVSQLASREHFGFKLNSDFGIVEPCSPAAQELWELGLNNHKKFFVNQKTESQLMLEALELGKYKRDPYILRLNLDEIKLSKERRHKWCLSGGVVIGINTGCSNTLPFKKFSVSKTVGLIHNLQAIFSDATIVLLGGGGEDKERNLEIYRACPDVILSPTDFGLRDGLVSTNACDIVLSGDSLGLHMAIALKKWVVAWFGPTCQQEIDLYDYGVKLWSKSHCAPCWSANCSYGHVCESDISDPSIIAAVQLGVESVLPENRSTPEQPPVI